MGSFEKLIPTVNPRRKLSALSNLITVMDDAQISNFVLSREATPTGIPVKETRETSDEVKRSIPLDAFLDRFFKELGAVNKYMLVQPLDEDSGKYCVGIFITQNTAMSWSESMALPRFMIADIVAEWRSVETQITKDLITNYTNLQSSSARRALEKLMQSMARIQSSVLGVSKSMVDDLSASYALVLSETDCFEYGIITFIREIIRLRHMHGYSETPSITNIPVCIKKIIPLRMNFLISDIISNPRKCTLSDIRLNRTLCALIEYNRDNIRDWFKHLF